MFTKKMLSILMLSFFVASFIYFGMPGKAMSQVGCCLVPGQSCFDEPGGTCMGNNTFCMTSKTRCDENQNAVFTEGEWCVVIPMADTCEPQGCCLIDDACQQAPETGCEDGLGGSYLGDGLCGQFSACDPPPQTGCCDEIPPEDTCDDIDITSDECLTLGGMFTVDSTCNFEDTCGEPIIVDGCCQIDEDMEQLISIDATCEDVTNVACFESGGMFSPGGTCDTEEGVCDFAPLGCCVFGPNDCDELTEEGCSLEGGRFEGDNVQCSDVPECNVQVVTAVPTLNQWGLIAVAGLLGFFSLFIIIRRREDII